jgi:hypothetical protein
MGRSLIAFFALVGAALVASGPAAAQTNSEPPSDVDLIGVQVFTSGSGTYTPDAGTKSIVVELVGAHGYRSSRFTSKFSGATYTLGARGSDPTITVDGTPYTVGSGAAVVFSRPVARSDTGGISFQGTGRTTGPIKFTGSGEGAKSGRSCVIIIWEYR